MADISLETVTGKLNRLGYDAFMRALRHAKKAGNRNVEMAHWLLHIVTNERSDVSLTLDHYKLERAKILKDLTDIVDGFRKNETEMPGIATQITDALDRGWHYATLFFGETQIRTGHVLVAALKSHELRRSIVQLSKQFGQLDGDRVASEARDHVGAVGRGKPAADGRLRADRAERGAGRRGGGSGPRQHRARPLLDRHDGHCLVGQAGSRSSAATTKSARSSTCCCAVGRTIRSSPARPASARPRWSKASRSGWRPATCRRN